MKQHRPIKFKSRTFLIVISVAIGFATGLGSGYFLWFDINPPEIEQALVVRVIDGDTVELIDGSRVRYLGIDTPETDEYFYEEATEKNRELVEGKIVELQSGKRDKDAYNRLLRYVYIDGTFVNAELVAGGYATAYIFDASERYSQILVQLEQYAKLKDKGLWAEQ